MSYAERQANQARGLIVPPRPCDVVTKFEVEQWSSGTLCVTREYYPTHAPSLLYSDCYAIGPRGGMKEIFRNLLSRSVVRDRVESL